MLTTALLLTAAVAQTVYAATFDVQVGAGGQLVYEPSTISAMAGDVVRFHFNPKNHTVTQSSFDAPCSPLASGLDLGFNPVAAGADPLVKELTVPDNGGKPLWFYCAQTVGTHCQKGMVFAINAPTEGNTFEAFKAAAMASGSGTTTAPPAVTTTVFVTPSPQSWTVVTTTVTQGASTWSTTYTSYSGTPEPTKAITPVDHKIIVGADGKLAYSPANISAAIGDTVTFEFRPKNHTVTQSSFSNPCQSLAGGFKSGFKPVDASLTSDFPTFQITINDTAPIWGYCGQVNHCQSGMVFAINAVESGPNNFDNFVELAKRSNTTSAGQSSASPSPTGGSGSNGAVSNAVTSGAAIVAGFTALMISFL